MKKFFLLLFLVLGLGLITVSPVFAKRLLPYLRKTTSTSKTTATTTTGRVNVSARFRADRRAIVVTFSNLGAANKVDYFLSYNSKGITQGASGTIMDTSQGITRELLFGSCSKGVCRYDTGITNAKFVVNSYLPNGKKVIKSFRIKI